MTDSRGRTVQWLFVISVALFVSGIAFIISAARTARAAPAPAPSDLPAPVPVASIKQIMNSIVMPNATAIYNAVGSTIDGNKIEEFAPKNDKEWEVVGDSAAAIVESGNMLLVGDRVIDTREWVSFTQRFIAAGKAALVAATQKKPGGVLAAGGDLNVTCDACLEKYQRAQ